MPELDETFFIINYQFFAPGICPLFIIVASRSCTEECLSTSGSLNKTYFIFCLFSGMNAGASQNFLYYQLSILNYQLTAPILCRRNFRLFTGKNLRISSLTIQFVFGFDTIKFRWKRF
jgi:hypothetical protein